MRAIVLSDNQTASFHIRQQLLREGLHCLAEDMQLLDRAADKLAQATPDLVVVVLSPNPELALDKLAELRLLTQARLLAVGPGANARLVLSALRTGEDDFLDENELAVELPAALARMQSELPVQAEAARLHVAAKYASDAGSPDQPSRHRRQSLAAGRQSLWPAA